MMNENINIEITPEELSLLTSISVNEKKVREGQLNNWQKQLLMEIKAVRSVLNDKYPSSSFEIKECTGTSTQNGFSTFLFSEASHEEMLFDASCTPDIDSKGDFRIEDNYYRVFLEPVLKDTLHSILRAHALEPVQILCSYTSMLGKEADETITLDSVIKNGLKVQPTIQIILDGNVPDDNAAAEQITQASRYVKDLSVPGFYVLRTDSGTGGSNRISFSI